MKKVLAAVLTLAMVLLLGACASEKKNAAGSNASHTGSQKASSASAGKILRGGTLNIGKGVVLSTLDPTKVTARDSDYDVLCQIYEPLIKADDSGNLVPGLANSWNVVNDTTIVFHLRKDVKFQDGTLFDANAVKANFDYYTAKSTGAIFATELAAIKNVQVVDDNTVQINLSAPSANFLTDLTNYSGLMIAPSALEKGAGYLATHACGTGPFKVENYTQNVSITLAANKDYYVMGKDGKPLPYVDKVNISMITNQTTKLNSLMSGGCDLTDYLETTGIETLEKANGFHLQRISTSDIYCLFCNVGDKTLSDKKVRQALAYAVNGDEIAKALTRGRGFKSVWACDPDQWFYSDSTPYSNDTKKAKELLKEAGYANGLTLTMQCIAREPDNTIMQVLQQQLTKVGIKLQLESMDRTKWVSIWTTEHSGQLGLAKMTVPRVDAYVQLYTNMGATSANNYSQYQGAKFNELLKSLSVTYDTEKQKSILKQAQAAYLDDCATIFLYQMPRYDAYSNRVQNFSTYALGPWNLSEIWLAS